MPRRNRNATGRGKYRIARLPSKPVEIPRCATSGKHRFENERSAEAERRAVIARHGDGGHPVPVRVYACPHCGGWHLTSRPARRDDARRSLPPRSAGRRDRD